MLDYRQLEALAIVVREGGFERAAQAMHLTQSAVSQRIRALEEQLGQVVLARTQPPGLTRAGELLLRHVQEVERLESEVMSGVLPDEGGEEVASVPIAVNADSLSTWFSDAIAPLVSQWRLVLDVRLDDQELTHKLLRSGDVMGCVSAKSGAAQGCRVEYLGCMNYRMLATPAFARVWFPDGFTLSAARRAPLVVFNRKNQLHGRLFRRVFRRARIDAPVHYMPSPETYLGLIESGLAHGVVPELQAVDSVKRGKLIDVAPEQCVRVDLHWHRWNLRSALLDELTDAIVEGARAALPQR